MKKITDYKAIIVDLDGTLYYQKPVRLAMATVMASRFWRIKDFLIVKKYREMFEQGLTEEERMKLLPDGADKIINEWMIQRPLKYVRKYRDKEMIADLDGLIASGFTVIVCSDYPVKEKLGAIGFEPHHAYSATDLGCMKPDAEGLARVLRKLGIKPDDCLVIGDRYEKDGLLARNMNAGYVILPKGRKERKELYSRLF